MSEEITAAAVRILGTEEELLPALCTAAEAGLRARLFFARTAYPRLFVSQPRRAPSPSALLALKGGASSFTGGRP